MQATKVIGPALGGLLVAASRPAGRVRVDAATFLVSARDPEPPAAAIEVADAEARTRRTTRSGRGYWQELREGLAYIFEPARAADRDRQLRGGIFLLFCFDALSPLAFRELGVSKALFGIAIAGIGLGGVLGTIAVGRCGGDVNPFVLMGGGDGDHRRPGRADGRRPAWPTSARRRSSGRRC